MSTPTRVTAGANAQITDLNQLIDLVEGGNSMTENWLMVATPGTDFKIRLGDHAGTNKLLIQDSTGATVASFDSLGTFTPSVLLMPTSASPSQVTAGQLAWDTTRQVITVGDGTRTLSVGLTTGAGANATAANHIVWDSTSTSLKVWDGSASQSIGTDITKISNFVRKYKTAVQTLTTTTTYADVTASSGSFAFAIAANEVWEVEYWIPLAFGGTGGAKFQITGPSAPTNVDITGYRSTVRITSTTDSKQVNELESVAGVTAFSSDIAAASSHSGTYDGAGDGLYPSSGTLPLIVIRAHIQNGANAGTVTLQVAQNSSNTTTTVGIGAFMVAQKVA